MWMWIWFGLALTLLVAELCTIDLVAIWFAISALVLGILAAIFTELQWGWQALIFVLLSTGLFLATRPFVKKFMKRKKGQETNLELVIDNTARVVEVIDNSREVGAAKINGLIWTARSVDGSIIEVDELVLVKEIKGNKLIVEKKIGGR